MNKLLEVEQLCKMFHLRQQGNKTIVSCENINISLNSGEFVGITGKSGAGKSTILKCLYRTYLPTGGHLWFQSDRFGRIDLSQASEQQMLLLRKEEIGYVSQFLKVLPRVSALDVVKEAVMELGQSETDAENAARAMLAFFRLPENLWDTYPNTFSGGEKLRLNLAKSMVKRPKLLLLDEPTASLDEASKELVKEMLIRLKQDGVSMIGIFHDLEFMDRVVDKTYVMQQGILHIKEGA